MATQALDPTSNNPQHDKGDTALVRGTRTTLQAIVGTFGTFLVGIGLSVWNVPGVPDAVLTYVSTNLPLVLLSIGVPVGLTSFVHNLLRKDVRNF